MKNLLSAFLPMLLILHAPGASYAQSAVPAVAKTQTAEPEKIAALNEAARHNAKMLELFRAGNLDEALPLAERVLAIREGVLPANDNRVGHALANIAALRLAKKEHDKAETFYLRALAVYEASGDHESASVMGVLDQLVFLAASKRNFDKAEGLAQRIVTIAEKKYKPEQIEIARALINLAEVSRLRLDNKKARAIYTRIVEIAEKHPPASVPKEINLSLANYLGILYAEEQGKDSELTERINKLFVTLASTALPGNGKEVQGGVLNGKSLYKPAPEYPFAAKQSRTRGTVKVQVTVDETGKVIAAKAIEHPDLILARASEAAALRARFAPTLLSGTPVKVMGIITYNFVLQ